MKNFLSKLAKYTLIIFLLLVNSSNIWAQEKAEKKKKDIDPEELVARKSAYRSMVLPGWGQATNGGAHWLKLPIIYGGLGTLGYIANFNHNKYKCYEKGYFLARKKLYLEGCDGYTTESALKNGMETYHQQRDLFIIVTAGFYALNILDAYVWAHLNQFDNSDDLTLNIYPSFTNIAGNQTAGFSLQFRF
ncbi:MAG: DUF5683 domain-containing protein [Bacteroidia bacterium]